MQFCMTFLRGLIFLVVVTGSNPLRTTITFMNTQYMKTCRFGTLQMMNGNYGTRLGNIVLC